MTKKEKKYIAVKPEVTITEHFSSSLMNGIIFTQVLYLWVWPSNVLIWALEAFREESCLLVWMISKAEKKFYNFDPKSQGYGTFIYVSDEWNHFYPSLIFVGLTK